MDGGVSERKFLQVDYISHTIIEYRRFDKQA